MPKQVIDDFITSYLKPFLKQEGFSKRGRTWVKHKTDLSFIINVQASKWNISGRSPEFFLNYGVFIPDTYETDFHMPVPAQPMEHDCIRRFRLYTITGEELWKITADKRRWFSRSRKNQIAVEIIDALKSQCFSYFDKIKNAGDVRR